MSFALVLALDIEVFEPRTYLEAITCTQGGKWIITIHEELLSLSKNKTWKIVNKPTFQKLVGCK